MLIPARLASFTSVTLIAVSLALAAGCSNSTEAPAGDPSAEENEADFEQEIKAKTDAQVKADIEAAALGASYTSESDYPFTYVSAKLNGEKSMTQALVREKLASFVDGDPAADKPLATLYANTSTFTEWKSNTASCQPDEAPSPEDCAKINTMNAALAKNLRGIKVFYFGRDGSRGHVDGVGVSVIIVGRTPSGNLAGVRTIAIWT